VSIYPDSQESPQESTRESSRNEVADLAGTTAVVTGASRGFGRAIAGALVGAGVRVVGVARDRAALEQVRDELGDGFVPVAGDAAGAWLAGRVLDDHRPRTLVLNAGADPLTRPIHRHTWESFGAAWEVDVKQAFHWVREALLQPLPAGSTVVSVSSGAALAGSPLSGGYSGAKATVRFVSQYAAAESALAGLGIRFVALLPKLTPVTTLGGNGVRAYADRQGVDVPTFLEGLGPVLSIEEVSAAVLGLVADGSFDRPAYALDPAGLRPLD
jgi:NAD(P)-dependent dehydrogenase (short-subunit alcohol dehydrogenase family)